MVTMSMKWLGKRVEVSEKSALSPYAYASDITLASCSKTKQCPQRSTWNSDAAGQHSRFSHQDTPLVIMVIIPTIEDYFCRELLGGIEATAKEHGHWMVAVNGQTAIAGQPLVFNRTLVKRVNGILLLGADLCLAETLAQQKNLPPLVMLNEFIPELTFPTVHIDNLTAAFGVVSYLSQLGHQRIACIAGPSSTSVSQSRTEGYLQGLRRSGLVEEPRLLISSELTMAEGAQALKRLMTQAPPPTAVFCHSDLVAIGALHQARELGISIPRELSIVGFDDIQLAQYSTPPLTTVAQPHYEIGRQATLLLFEILSDRTTIANSKLLESQLVIRATTAPPNALPLCKGTSFK